MPEPIAATPTRPPVWPAAVLALLFLLAAVPLILFGGLLGQPGWDQFNYHEVMIREFARTWPWIDCSNYLSATTPLYHWLLAGLVRFISDSREGLQLAGSLFTVALLALLARACTRELPRRPALALLLCLPFAASMFVFPSGVWLLPDNSGWLGVLAIWVIALEPGWSWRRALGSAALLLLLVLTRQIHIWAAALVWVPAWLGGEKLPGDSAAFLPVRNLLRPRADRLKRAIPAFLLTLPSFGAVLGFILLWGGLIVPRYQGFYNWWGPTTPDFGLTLLAIYSVFFAGWLWPGLRDSLRRHRRALVIAAILGLLAAIYPNSTYSVDEGRYGAIWNLTRETPVIAGRSLIFLVGAPIGACALVLWLTRLPVRDRVIMLTAFVAFEAAQCACKMTWQRYSEPMLVMFCILAAVRTPAARTPDAQPRSIRAAMIAGPALLALIFASLTANRVAGGGEASTEPRDPMTSPHYWGPPQAQPPVYTEEVLPGAPPR